MLATLLFWFVFSPFIALGLLIVIGLWVWLIGTLLFIVRGEK